MLLKQDLWEILVCQWQCTVYTNFYITVQFEKVNDWH